MEGMLPCMQGRSLTDPRTPETEMYSLGLRPSKERNAAIFTESLFAAVLPVPVLLIIVWITVLLPNYVALGLSH